MPASLVRTFTDPDAYHAAIRDTQADGVITGRGSLSDGQAIEVGSAHWRHAAAVRRLEDFFEANSGRTLYVTALCGAAAISDRTLRTLCQEHLGMSPARYLWLRRIHLARRALPMADPATTTVTKIATNYGFWELARFSVEYRYSSLLPLDRAAKAHSRRREIAARKLSGTTVWPNNIPSGVSFEA